MLNKVKRILQWFIGGCYILSGLACIGEYTMPAIILIILGGVIILPPITKRIPAFKFKKIALILLSSIVMIAGIELGETNLSPEVLAKRKAESEAAAASQNEKDQKKIDEYKSLILRNYANPDGASKGDQSKFFGIADNEEELKLFTRAWREALYETCMGEDPIPSDTSHGTYIKMVDVFSGFVHLYSYYYKLNAEGGVEKWIPYEYNLYRNILVTSSSFDKAFNDTYKGFIKPQSEYPDAYTDTFYISQKLSNSTGNSILDVLNDAFSDGSSEWVGYKGGFFSYNDDACVLVTAKGMSFSESGDYSLTYVESGKTTTLTDSRGFEQEADIYYAYNTDEFSEAYENLNTVDNEIADESSLIFEFLIGNENYTDWQ